jgi:hypothetical protein
MLINWRTYEPMVAIKVIESGNVWRKGLYMKVKLSHDRGLGCGWIFSKGDNHMALSLDMVENKMIHGEWVGLDKNGAEWLPEYLQKQPNEKPIEQ